MVSEPVMPTLPLWQPWASLVVLGAKRIETRHWPAPARVIGQRVAIHATKTRDWLHLCDMDPFSRYVTDAAALPLGCVIGTAVIDRCEAMEQRKIDQLEERMPHEHAFGLYEVGRFAWVLRDPEPLRAPVPWTGRQGIFNVPLLALGLEPGDSDGEIRAAAQSALW